MKENIEYKFNDITRKRSFKLWVIIIAFLSVATVLSLLFLDNYRSYYIEYFINNNKVKYENNGVVFYGGSSIFITLLAIGGLSLLLMVLYSMAFKKSGMISQMGMSLSVFLILSLTSIFFAPPTANFSMTIYYKDLISSEYTWVWPREGGRVSTILTDTWMGNKNKMRLYVNDNGGYFNCIDYHYSWIGSLQKKESLWPIYISRLKNERAIGNYCTPLSDKDVVSLSKKEKDMARIFK
ncbi:hypothetical protein SOASR030_28610 [Leminorella grimontii]|uniref:Uncharacterized protein n=1 Tax=Leminorella grimontii TaxID=82981 RepID=A0AAV5N6R2_9GAMM|nr:hypothetical protein [Leminorella grimontii]KFC92866.1 hypothetical protein GLGR_3562 [Leminorella grimontii ATCC 33999 = DSM 5078]GKX56749.1 hypothetical protein SOASR030_28610 [Leminorella grimontii]